MRAIRYHGPKQPLRIEEVATPSPGSGEVLIRVTAAGICHTELHFLSGLLDRGVDVVFELVASKETMAASTATLGKRGRLVFIGYSEDSYTVHPIQLVTTEASVMGSVGNTLGELVRAIDLVARGKVETVVDRVLPLDHVQKGIDALAKGELVGRAVLRP